MTDILNSSTNYEELIKSISESVIEKFTPNTIQTRQQKSSQAETSGSELFQNVEFITTIVGAIVRALMPLIAKTVTDAINASSLPSGNDGKSVNTDNCDEVLKVKLEVDDLNLYQRRDNVRINGLQEDPEETNDQLVEKVLQLGESIGAQVSRADISVAHRLKAKVQGIHQVIVKFTSRHAKEDFYKAKKKLKDVGDGKSIFINEDLTSLRFKMLQAAKTCVGYRNVTTHNGKILVWKIDTTTPVSITRPEDLRKLGVIPNYAALGLR